MKECFNVHKKQIRLINKMLLVTSAHTPTKNIIEEHKGRGLNLYILNF